jgi:hypothetical protein
MKMLEIFKERLVPGLTIVNVKERASKYTICVEYEGKTTTIDLSKTCTPKQEERYCDIVIAGAMASIFFNAQDFENARIWLEKCAFGGNSNE